VAIDTASARAGLLELLNDARRDAGVPELVEAPEQSRIAEQLAPYFFEAHSQPNGDRVMETVMLGLMAGWFIDGVVQSGHFTGSQLNRSNDLNRLISEALDRPTARAQLLADDVDRVAIGPVVAVVDGEPILAAIFGTYSLFSEAEHENNRRRVYELLGEQRAENGQPKPRDLPDIELHATTAAGIVQAGGDPRVVLGELIADSVDRLQRSVQGWMVETTDLDDIRFPADYLDRRDLEVAVGVAYRKEPDSPWGHYVVLVIAAEPGGRGA
jgi:hypothetical protein